MINAGIALAIGIIIDPRIGKILMVKINGSIIHDLICLYMVWLLFDFYK